jgi:hypothetical protein
MAKTDTSTNINSIQTKDQAVAPATPAAGYAQVYTVAGALYVKRPDGNVYVVGGSTASATITTVLFTQVFS